MTLKTLALTAMASFALYLSGTATSHAFGVVLVSATVSESSPAALGDDTVLVTECALFENGAAMGCATYNFFAPKGAKKMVKAPYICTFSGAEKQTYQACFARGQELMAQVETPADLDVFLHQFQTFAGHSMTDIVLEAERLNFVDDVVQLSDRIYGTQNFKKMQAVRNGYERLR